VFSWISFAVGELPFAFESSAFSSSAVLDCWIVGLLDSLRGCLRRCWIHCVAAFGGVGLLDCWIVGLLDCWIVGLLDCWIVGLLDCWIVGLLRVI
jgi:hypothetical protein